jgi:hypothetical protein
MNPQEVIPYIEGEPMISKVPVEPGMTNVSGMAERITGSNTEDTENGEGMVRFDVVLSEKLPEIGKEEYRLHRFLGTIFSETMKADDKIKLLEDEYEIPMERKLKEGIDGMCNLGQGIVEKTTKRLSTEYTIAIMDSFGIGVDEAMEKLKVDEKDRESLKAAVEEALGQAVVAN